MSYSVIKHGEVISRDIISTVNTRYETLTRAINREFWNLQSAISHSLLVGSYGRGTAIDTSDIDVLVELPKSEYERYDILKGNGPITFTTGCPLCHTNSLPQKQCQSRWSGG